MVENKIQYYNGTKLLKKKDLENNTPEIFVVVGNRGAGKSFYFKEMLLRKYLEKKEMFLDIVRYKYEVPDRVSAFYTDLMEEKYADLEVESKKMISGNATAHIINGEIAGYTVALSSADTLRKYSSMFVHIMSMFFDEFQLEGMNYLPDEVNKIQSLHMSVARGGGKQSRYVPVYMASNVVSVINPYFYSWGFTTRINKDTKFLRGIGVVLEQCYNESAAQAAKQSAFNRAFQNSKYLEYAASNVALADNYAFIENVNESDSWYMYTIVYDNKDFALWQNERLGILFVNRKIDYKRRNILTFKGADHDINRLLLMRMEDVVARWRLLFQQGCFRFADLECKQAFLDILAIR